MMKTMEITEIPVHPSIISVIKTQGITTLYPPQEEAIPPIIEGKNVLLSIPTASGKSLVAYLAILHNLITHGGKALYIVPLIALAKEKYHDLKQFESIGFRVGISTGDLDDSDPRLSNYDIIICTSEKADSLFRHHVSWMQDVHCVVVDEIHLIHDPTRGPTLEVLIARFQSMPQHIQFIGLSATIANATEMSIWLDARLIQSDWRPVPLHEGVFFDGIIYFENGAQRTVKKTYQDPLMQLVYDTLFDKGQVLIFVNTRRSTASVARKISALVKKQLTDDEKQRIEQGIGKITRQHVEHTVIDDQLFTCLKSGVAFHHAGLASHQRRVIEEEFKKGIIKVIVATPTLAAGVNIPAKRVIIRDLWRYDMTRGMKPIPVLEYKQQAGRAGRPTYDEFGEAITIAQDEKKKDLIFYTFLHGEVEPILSKLGNQAALRMHLLAAIATGFVQDKDDIHHFIENTFYAHQTESYSLYDAIDETISFLHEHEFITVEEDTYIPTLFGKRTSGLYIDPLSAVEIKNALQTENPSDFSEISFLHVISSTPDVRSLYLRKHDSWVEDQVELVRDDLMKTPPLCYEEEYEWFLSDMKTAFLLFDWVNEVSEDMMISKYGVGPGDIHSIVDTAHWLIHATREFSRMYQPDAVSYLTKLLIRIKNGCKEELLPLIKIKGVGRIRARSLFEAGFTSIQKLRKVSVQQISQVKTIGPRIAENIKKQIGERTDVMDSSLQDYQEMITSEDDDL
jgi:helicase